MNIETTRLQSRPLASPGFSTQAPEASTAFGLEFDPFSGIKDAFRTTVEETGQFVAGALPGFGVASHMRQAIFGSSSQSGKAKAGVLLNATGTVCAAVALGQMAFGVDPSLAFGLSAATLGGSGVLNAMVNS